MRVCRPGRRREFAVGQSCDSQRVFEEVRERLEHGEEVKLSGFGNFELRDKSQRPGRNPKTGEEIPISARRVVTFRPGQKLRLRVSVDEADA